MMLWTPSAQDIAHSNMTRFMQATGHANYTDLYQWSIDQPEQFWPAVLDFCNLVTHRPWKQVLSVEGTMQHSTWFEGCTLNFAENLLRHHASDHAALIFHNENGERHVTSYSALYHGVAQLAAALKQRGVKHGDRVAGYLPNRPETIAAMLATASLGAIWSSCSLDFGFNAVFDRFKQIEPVVLFAADGHYYQGKTFDATQTLSELIRQLPSLKQTVVIDNIHTDAAIDGTVRYADFLDTTASTVEFVPVPFDHPLYILFSSGTTGVPKCIVHGAGGTLIQHLKELVLHTDLKPSDTIFYYTTCGWMMWNWLVSSLAVGATLVLYDGAPMYPDSARLFDLIDQEHISIFGTSAKFLSAAEKSGLKPITSHALTSLRCILSTGSPLVPQNYRFVYDQVKSDLRLSSISGGTDIVSCFALGNPNLPVYSGELQCRGLGMRVEIFNEQGQSVRQEKGELVCTAPFPSMPVGFWQDPDGKLYQHAYFDRYDGVWAHGDFAEITEHDGLIIYGRSDTVLNPGGVRVGTAEIYRAVEKIDSIQESIAIGRALDDDVQIVLFVVLKPGHQLDDDLIKRIQDRIKTTVSPYHVPKIIKAVPDIPRTISGKIVELAVKNVVEGHEVKNVDALANPDALDYFRGIL